MEIDKINKWYKFLILNTVDVESCRVIDQSVKRNYQIELSHIYIKRHLTGEWYILKDNILIKSIWVDLIKD